jgi:hypothetical protein
MFVKCIRCIRYLSDSFFQVFTRRVKIWKKEEKYQCELESELGNPDLYD